MFLSRLLKFQIEYRCFKTVLAIIWCYLDPSNMTKDFQCSTFGNKSMKTNSQVHQSNNKTAFAALFAITATTEPYTDNISL